MRDQHVARCCRQIVRRPRDLGLATQTLRDTAELFATMIDAALQRVERRYDIAPEATILDTRSIGQVA